MRVCRMFAGIDHEAWAGSAILDKLLERVAS